MEQLNGEYFDTEIVMSPEETGANAVTWRHAANKTDRE